MIVNFSFGPHVDDIILYYRDVNECTARGCRERGLSPLGPLCAASPVHYYTCTSPPPPPPPCAAGLNVTCERWPS